MIRMRPVALGIAFTLSLFAFAPQARAATILTIGDSHYMGRIDFGIPAGEQDVADYLTFLGNMAPPSGPTADAGTGQTYTRSSNVLCYSDNAVTHCPNATIVGDAIGGAGVSTGNFGTGFLYLTAKYDGPNYGTEVWYVGGLTGTFSIPTTAGGFGLSGARLYNPGGPPCDPNDPGPSACQQNFDPVPEPGSLLLLGTGLFGTVGAMRRRWRKS